MHQQGHSCVDHTSCRPLRGFTLLDLDWSAESALEDTATIGYVESGCNTTDAGGGRLVVNRVIPLLIVFPVHLFGVSALTPWVWFCP